MGWRKKRHMVQKGWRKKCGSAYSTRKTDITTYTHKSKIANTFLAFLSLSLPLSLSVIPTLEESIVSSGGSEEAVHQWRALELLQISLMGMSSNIMLMESGKNLLRPNLLPLSILLLGRLNTRFKVTERERERESERERIYVYYIFAWRSTIM